MKSLVVWGVTLAACLVTTAPASFAQTTSIQLFGPVNVRLSTNGASAETPNTFNSTTLNLNCPASGISAVISSGPNGSGNILVDNFINLTPTIGTTTGKKTNICSGGVVEGSQQNDCFTTGYQSPAGAGNLTGQDPDLLVDTGGVAPINIASFLASGPVQAQISLEDTGGLAASSSLYLTTNCTQTGVSGPGNVTGNPISNTNPTSQQLTQDFSFDGSVNQLVQFRYDLSEAQSANTLTIANDDTIPNMEDEAIDPTTFQSLYLANTSFATANCLIHQGELLNNAPACKLYTLECQIGTGSTQSGAQCPVSSAPNEVFTEDFDGPSFTLPDIATEGGTVFHQGVAFLMAAEPWSPTAQTEPCAFDPASGFANDSCPQNLLTGFAGAGTYHPTGRGGSVNSSFIVVAPVPEDLTTVTVAGQTPYGWVNTPSPAFTLTSTPPNLTNTTTPVPGQSSFVPSPIQSITYGISTPSTVPTPGPIILTDTSVLNPVACPIPPATEPAQPFITKQTISNLADGQYLLHYYAQDCAGTQELKFTEDVNSVWSTSFYTVPVNVDTVPPVVATGPTLSPPPSTNYGIANSYLLNQPVTASYSCTDATSGVVTCGAGAFSPTPNTGTVTSPVNTSIPGPQTFTVKALDAAGNPDSASVGYLVVAPPVNLVIGTAILKPLLPSAVKTGTQITYGIGVANLSKNTALGVKITDPLPAGVTFVKASTLTGPAQCSFAGNTVTCTAASLGPLIPLNSNSAIGIQIVVQVTAGKGATISNTATVTSENPDLLSNQSTAIVTVH